MSKTVISVPLPPDRDNRKPSADLSGNLNSRLYDDAVVRQVDVLRYRESLVDRTLVAFRAHDEAWLDRLGGVFLRLSNKDFDRIGSSARLMRGTERTKAFVEAVREWSASSRDIGKTVVKELKELAFDEAVYWTDRLAYHTKGAVGLTIAPPKKAAVAELFANTLIFGESIPAMVDRWGRQRQEFLMSIIRQQFYDGVEAGAVLRNLSGKSGALARQVDGTPTGLGNKLRTATGGSSIIGQQAFQNSNDDIINDLIWVSVLDSRTSHLCQRYHGRLVNKELGGQLPPGHVNCLPGDSYIAPCGDISAISKRWFDGELVTINTALALPLRCTPNHPVLTQRGWVPAGEIDVGDKLFHIPVGDGVALAEAQNQQPETRFDDLLESLLATGEMVSREVPSTAPDFHGDGTDGQVNEIFVHRDLAFESNTSAKEGLDDPVSYPETLSDVLRFYAGQVEACDVISVSRAKFSGHVYNLETTEGFYKANGVIVHNCRSSTVPGVITDEQAQKLGISVPPDGVSWTGNIPGRESASAWFARQDEALQRKLLGPSRLELYKTGRYAWPDNFISGEGKRWTLDELRKRARAA